MINVDHLNKSYGKHTILSDISLTINDNQTTVILGSSGAGKSTLLRSFDLLDIPDSGTLTIASESIEFRDGYTNEQLQKIRAQTSIVFQSWNLFPHLTVLGNVIKGPISVLKKSQSEANRDARALLKQVGLENYENYYPVQLSGGQQQRVAIARALAMEPKFILLDEPTSALDPQSEANVLNVLSKLSRQGQALVIVTHNMAFARAIADEIVFLEAGKVSFSGSPSAFFTSKNERIERFLNKQTALPLLED
ncbi:amino acid ABC transporter ATP-binding protein [Leuconostoc miyukkimchii]|uniref:amino acid ABC transporter ATP-binding protein n=1 Tax=Leuconostoc miyukkimchii TaxID=910540 RepID=UPI001C7DB4A5|nr:amino acid ABC transporter ATP-binding protein [Leuconostoc miyukkimchii]